VFLQQPTTRTVNQAIPVQVEVLDGTGGRDVAARLLEDAHRKTRENADTIKDDLARGRDRAQQAPVDARDEEGEGDRRRRTRETGQHREALNGADEDRVPQGRLLALAPGLALTIVVYAINVFGDALRDLLDPRMRGSR